MCWLLSDSDLVKLKLFAASDKKTLFETFVDITHLGHPYFDLFAGCWYCGTFFFHGISNMLIM